MRKTKSTLTLTLLLFFSLLNVKAQFTKGMVIDKQTKEPLIGAVIEIEKGNKAVTNVDGLFEINIPKNNPYNLIVTYIGYKNTMLNEKTCKNYYKENVLRIEMQSDDNELEVVNVTGVARTNTEVSAVMKIKNSNVIQNSISSQEISKTQDTNAGEVIRRVPGISIIEDKFVMVRGLSQRYNNVWINGGAVPSSEADARAFSFDIIPSGQIDNISIVKTNSSEYPADYTGGFIMIETKEIPMQNTFDVAFTANWNTSSAFQKFNYYKGSSTDFLGFDSNLRPLNNGINTNLNTLNGNMIDLNNNGLNNDWLIKTCNPIGDFKLNASLSKRWFFNEYSLGMIAALNYTNEYKTYIDMENNLFGIYDASNNHSNYLRHSIDDQYNHNVRLGGMINFTFLSKSGNNKYQIKNIFNQLGNTRYTWREGISAQANRENSAEYFYSSRTTYNGQITGKYTLMNNIMDWNVSYSYSNRLLPDRKRFMIDDAIENNIMGLTTGNDISREWTRLDEHIFSASVNDKIDFQIKNLKPSLKVGVYAEYRKRKYTTREFIYGWNLSNNNLLDGFRFFDMPNLLSNINNFGEDKLYLLELMMWRNNYRGENHLESGYFSLSIPIGKIEFHAGLRLEHNDMKLVSNTKDYEKSEVSRKYITNDLFPSFNSIYKFNDQNQIRLSYGRSINRPEFREISPAVYYDFDLASNIQGNTELKSCYIDNVDLRYEYYPSKGELISIAAFYKNFNSPIEWTYTVAGGTDLIYSYKNAKNALSYGLEVDIRKKLNFIGLKNLSLSLNGSLIKSKVFFEKGSKEKDRAMQGQSPYLVNAGLFYENQQYNLNIGLLYNVIGKRIIGVGRSEGTTASDDNARIPDSYEMPRNVLDFNISKIFGEHFEIKFSVKDILAERVYYKQFAKVNRYGEKNKEVEEIVRNYKPGRNISLTFKYKL